MNKDDRGATPAPAADRVDGADVLRLEHQHARQVRSGPQAGLQSFLVDHWDLRFSAKGRVKDDQPATGDRRLRLTGAAAGSQIRVRRGDVAELTAMFSRDYLRDYRIHWNAQVTP